MKRILQSLLFLIAGATYGQGQRQMSSFQFFQSYFNPAQTGFEGTAVRGLYRNQWSGFDGAPKTFYLGGDFVEGGHGIGLNLYQDTFGPFRESELMLNYSYTVPLTREIQLRAGGAMHASFQRLDGSKMVLNQQGDQSLMDLYGTMNKSAMVDFNVGLSLTGRYFYLGYALNNASRGAIRTAEDFFQSQSNMRHIGQIGVRIPVSTSLTINSNGLMRYDAVNGFQADVQVKAVMMNMVWVGTSYRTDNTLSALVGMKLSNMQIGFVCELPTSKIAITRTTEFSISYLINRSSTRYHYLRAGGGSTRKQSIW
ncbi:MAG: PorP/SprF family type IX secretion system membrane protein [Cyclobacteriaceae bacterium]